MYKILLLFLTLYFKNTENLQVIYRFFEQARFSIRFSINASKLNNFANKYTDSITVTSYDEREPQITRIENWTNLKVVTIQDQKQKLMVTFNNVPKLIIINFPKNDINYIAANMFGHTGLETIWLFGNKIKKIEDGSFGNNVKIVSLYCNLLSGFRPEWFKNPYIITTLDLNGNRIKHIRKNAFKKFISMDRIDLSFNKIQTIEPGAFTARNVFSRILLAHNNLMVLNTDVLQDGHINLNYFDIRYNNLTFIPKKIIERLSVEKTPVIDGNPWQCPCYDHYIRNWVNWTTYGDDRFNPKDRHGEPRCVKAVGSFAKICVEIVSEELIEYYRENTSPPDTNRHKYCSCIRNARYGIGDWECYFGENFKLLPSCL